MSGKINRTEALLLTAFILLSLATIVLLVFSIRFFTSPGVRAQLSNWAVLQVAGMADHQPSSYRWGTAPTQVPNPSPTPRQPLPREQVAAPYHSALQEIKEIVPTPVPVFQVVEKQPPQGRLIIPSLGIDTSPVPVAVQDQEWDLTDLDAQVGWLQTTGNHPGDDTAMVIIGHITLPYPGGPGPFYQLSTLKPGDEVKYRDGDLTYTYHVKDKTIVTPDMVESLYRHDGSSLLLVTCTTYNVLEQRYDQRLLVEAVLVNVEY